MKRYIPILGLFLLAGCLSPAQQADVATSQQKAVFEARGAYVTAATAYDTYINLPFCAKSTKISLSNVCADPQVAHDLQVYNLKAKFAVDTAQQLVDTNPVVDLTSAIADAWAAVNAFKAYEASHAVRS